MTDKAHYSTFYDEWYSVGNHVKSWFEYSQHGYCAALVFIIGCWLLELVGTFVLFIRAVHYSEVLGEIAQCHVY
jgi:hypothetical protein